MALTTELLRANANLSALSDEQISAIVEMSNNDEATVIAKKTGEIYGGLDTDILSASGIAKEGTEKTYEYAKRVIGDLKGRADGAAQLNTQIADLTKEKTRLEGVIAAGGADAELKKELTKVKADLANVTKEYTTIKEKYDGSEAAHAKEILGLRIEGEISKATAGLKFKAEYPEAVTKVLLGQAIAKVKGLTPEYIDDGQGGKVLAFNENGVLMRNPENNLRPFTASELVQRELKAMGVLDLGRTQTGTGTQTTTTTTQTSGAVDLSGARTQSEAQELIAKALMQQGKVNGSKEFEDAMAQIWKDNIATLKTLPVA